MKKLFISLLVTFISISSFSQAKSEVDLMQALYGITKLEIVNAFVKPSEAQKEAFTTLYNEYETKRMELGKVRMELLNEYAEK